MVSDHGSDSVLADLSSLIIDSGDFDDTIFENFCELLLRYVIDDYVPELLTATEASKDYYLS